MRKATTVKFIAATLLLLLAFGCPDESRRGPLAPCNEGTTRSALSVMTYNLHIFDVSDIATRVPFIKVFLQDLIDSYLNLSDSKLIDFRDLERTRSIADQILSQSNPPDLIAFTELWSGDLARELEDRLASIYPHHFRPDADQDIFAGQVFGNGLMLFSKFPFISGTDDFVPFAKLEGADAYTIKGVGKVSFQVCDGPRMTAFLAHTQAVYTPTPGADANTLDNIRQISELVNAHRDANP